MSVTRNVSAIDMEYDPNLYPVHAVFARHNSDVQCLICIRTLKKNSAFYNDLLDYYTKAELIPDETLAGSEEDMFEWVFEQALTDLCQ